MALPVKSVQSPLVGYGPGQATLSPLKPSGQLFQAISLSWAWPVDH